MFAVGAVLLVVLTATPASAYDCTDEEAMTKAAREARQSDDAIGLIQHLEMTCDLAVCRVPGVLESMRDLMDLCVGAPYTIDIRKAAVQRLKDTGFFEKVRVSEEEVVGGYSVSFELIGATIIRDIDYHGVAPLLESEVERRLQLRKGRPFRATADELQRQQDAVRELYEKSGFYGTKVQIVAARISDDSKLVDVDITITKGQRLAVGDLEITGNRSISRSEIRSELLAPMSWWSCVSLIPPFRFYCYTDARYKEGIEAVRKLYRDRGFYRVRVQDGGVDKDFDNEEAKLALTVEEGPRWELVFVGHRVFNDDELAEQTTFGESGFVDAVEIENSVEAIRSLYETAGHYFVEVDAQEVERERVRQIIFTVREGPASELVSVDLEGNTVRPAPYFTEKLGTQPVELFTEGYLQDGQLVADLELIVALYQDLGYLSATIERWKLVARNEQQDLALTIEVDEGQQTNVGDLVIIGNNVMTATEIREALKSRPGQPFSLTTLQRDAQRVLDIYKPLGYPQVSVAVKCAAPGGEWIDCALPSLPPECVPENRREREQEGLCTATRQGDAYIESCRWVPDDVSCLPQGGIQTSTVNVRLEITEGKQIHVGELFLRGNFRTRGRVIDNEIPFGEGDLFVEAEVLRGQRNLRSLGLFDSVSFVPLGIEEDEINRNSDRDRAALLITVEEAEARFLEFSFGAELRNALDDADRTLIFRAEQAVIENNVFGFGKQLQLKLKQAVDLIQITDRSLGQVDEQQNIKTTELTDIDYFIATELVYHDPRFLFPNPIDGGDSQKAVDFTLTPFYTLDLLGADDVLLDKEEWGARAAVRFRPLPKITLQLGLERKTTATRRRDEDPRLNTGERLFDPRRNTTAVSFRPTWDTRDSPLNPTRGFRADVELRYAFDILDSPIDFVKITANWAQFWPVLGDIVFGYHLRLGQAFPLAETTVIPDDERFRLGGVATLRGFEDDGVGPRDVAFQPQGGEFLGLGHVELRYPIWQSLGLYGAYFVDSGFLVDCLEDREISDPPGEDIRISCYDDVHLEDVRTSAGLGFRWVVASQIPISLDYAVILNRQPGEGVGDLHLNVGYTF